MRIKYEFDTVDGRAVSVLDDVDPDKAQERIWDAAERIGYSCVTATFSGMSPV